jgi:hypothetical protein
MVAMKRGISFGVALGLLASVLVSSCGGGGAGRVDGSASLSVGSISTGDASDTQGTTSDGMSGTAEGANEVASLSDTMASDTTSTSETATDDMSTSGQTSDASDSDTSSDSDSGGWDGPIIPETCDQAAQGLSTVGCRFFAVDMDSHDLAENGQYAVAIANVQLNQVAEVLIEVKNNGVWQVQAGPQNVQPLDLHTFPLPPRNTDDSQLYVGGAYRITSNVPVIAYQFNPVDGATSYLSDASMLYPVAALDTINHVIAWTSMTDNTGLHQHSYVTVVAAYDGTQIEVVPSIATAAGPGVPAGQAGQSFFVNLDEGDVLSVANSALGTSMTGTRILSNQGHPVAVFAGHECALIPANVCCCDHLEEQLSGVRLWGTEFVASRMPVRNTNNPEQSLWQIYASEDGTQVQLAANAGVNGLPALNFNLDAGQMQQFYVNGPAADPGDFHVVSDKPIAVLNYMIGAENLPAPLQSTGDPAAVQVSPVEQFLPRYVVLVPGTWITDVAVLTRPAGAMITIDGVPVNDNLFIPVANSGYEVARVPIADGVHVLDGGTTPFSVIIVGYDQHDSYAYLGGTGTGVINPIPQ